MVQTIQDVMTANPTILDASTPLREAARAMRDGEIGDVLVSEDGELCGIATDRDIVVRGLAAIADLADATIGDVCTRHITTVSPTDPLPAAVEVMRDHAVRRLPVVRDGTPVGIVSLGDLAIQQDPNSALAEISAAPTTT